MTDNTEDPISSKRKDETQESLFSLKVEADLEKLDRQADHEYVPMDVFVGPMGIKQHFDASSIRARWTEAHSKAA